MQRQIRNWRTGAVIWAGEAETVKDAIHAAYAAGGTNLGGANLWGADLAGVKNFRLPTGETWAEYLTETVPALLTAGGKSLDSFAKSFDCHSWDNCPMAHAFDGHNISSVPILLRPRAEQFIQLFDAKQIPWPLPTKEQLEAEVSKHGE